MGWIETTKQFRWIPECHNLRVSSFDEVSQNRGPATELVPENESGSKMTSFSASLLGLVPNYQNPYFYVL